MRLQTLVTAVARKAGQELVLHHLLRDRARTLTGCITGEVRQQRSGKAAQVDAVVQVELLVLDSQERAEHARRHLLQCDRLAVFALEHGDHVAGDVVAT